jgi:hypothetical protein
MYKPDYHKNVGQYLLGMGIAFLAAVPALAASGFGVLDPAYWRGVDDLQRIQRNGTEGVQCYYPPGEMERREEEFHNNIGRIRALREKHQQPLSPFEAALVIETQFVRGIICTGSRSVKQPSAFP